MRFIYVMDPMCAWCYGFQPELDALLAHFPSIDIEWVMGGLAPDTKTPMDHGMRQTIATYWHQIEAKSQVTFNHEYWVLNTPIRSTYQACRAVIAAEMLKPNSVALMVKAIQSAYYTKAQNPSLDTTLLACAREIGLDTREFELRLASKDVEQRLQQQLVIAQELRVMGFPALFYVDENHNTFPLTFGFTEVKTLVYRMNEHINS